MNYQMISYMIYKKTFCYNDFYDIFNDLIAETYLHFTEFDYVKAHLDGGDLTLEIFNATDLDLKSWVNISGLSDKSTIYISDLFLAYLWCQSYVNIVQFDYSKWLRLKELKIPVQVNPEPTYDGFVSSVLLESFSDQILKNAVRKWGNYPNSLAPLPNPFLIEASHKEYVLKANSIFSSALSFILQHEFNHYYYSEHEYNEPSILKQQQQEISADSAGVYTTNLLSQPKAFSYAAGIATAFIAIHKIENKTGIKYVPTDKHPPTIERLLKAVSALPSLIDDDLLYEYMAYSLDLVHNFGKPVEQDGNNYSTSKEYFSDILKKALSSSVEEE